MCNISKNRLEHGLNFVSRSILMIRLHILQYNVDKSTEIQGYPLQIKGSKSTHCNVLYGHTSHARGFGSIRATKKASLS